MDLAEIEAAEALVTCCSCSFRRYGSPCRKTRGRGRDERKQRETWEEKKRRDGLAWLLAAGLIAPMASAPEERLRGQRAASCEEATRGWRTDWIGGSRCGRWDKGVAAAVGIGS